MSKTILEVAEPECAAEDFDGEIIAINLDTGVYFSLKDTAALLWQDLAGGHSVESLVDLAGGNEELAQAIKRFAGELVDGGLMRTAQSSRAVAEPPKWATLPLETVALPYLESFANMQNLLLLDPVHEVEPNAGWPKVRDG